MTRQRTPLAFGGSGLVRGTGQLVTEPASLTDLRNVMLRPGRALRRGGLTSRATLASETAIIGVHPVRSQGVGACLSYRESTREVRLWLVAADGISTLIGVVWTLPATAAFPRVSMVDVFNRLVIAHDEPRYGDRQPTRVWTPGVAGIVDLVAQLYVGTGAVGAQPVRFRGVTRYLSYLVGWGYGSEKPADVPVPGDLPDGDRPEVVRLSLPDDPLKLRPEHYFLAGSRGDAVLGCFEAGGVLAVRKASESHEIFGFDRPSFGIRPIDPLFGVANPRLGVVVGGVNYFWSLEGPRMASGGASRDMALPLDLRGPAVEAAASTDPSDAFACYDPSERAVLFVFGQWAFVWHLEAEAWSYRQYGTRLFAGGILYRDTATTGLGPTASAAFTTAVTPTPAGDAAGATVSVTATVAGSLIGGEVLELWARPTSGGTWTRVQVTAGVTTGANVITSTATLLHGVPYTLAVRLALAAIGQGNALGSNPDDWAATTRGAATTPLPPIALRTAPGGVGDHFFTAFESGAAPVALTGRGAVAIVLTMPPLAPQAQLLYDVRHRPAGSSDPWVELAGVPFDLGGSIGRTVLVPTDAFPNLDRELEVRVRTADLTGAWVVVSVGAYFGPRRPDATIVTVIPDLAPPRYQVEVVASAEPAFSVDAGQFDVERLVGSTWSAEPPFGAGWSLTFAGASSTAIGGANDPGVLQHRARSRVTIGAIEYVSGWRS